MKIKVKDCYILVEVIYMDFYNDRVEIKYVLKYDEINPVLEFIKTYGTYDTNTNEFGEYKINTYYLMSWYARSRVGKNHGHLRIRHYLNNNKIFIEEKSKIQNLCYKTRYSIDYNEKELIKNFETIGQIENFLIIKEFKFSPQLLMIPILDMFEISYIRQAYFVLYDGTKFRATIDRELISNDYLLLPNYYILEIKTNSKDYHKIIELLLHKFNVIPRKFSKYKIAKKNCLVLDKSN